MKSNLDLVLSFLSLLFVLAIPMLSSLVYFFRERAGNSSKKIYLKYMILFFIFYFLIYILFRPLLSFIDFIFSPIEKYFDYEILYLIMISYIIYILLCIKIMKKYFSFNDINLFFILSSILTFVIIDISIYISVCDLYCYRLLFYMVLSVSLSWILFFINIVVQNINSRKRKNQNRSDTKSTKEYKTKERNEE